MTHCETATVLLWSAEGLPLLNGANGNKVSLSDVNYFNINVTPSTNGAVPWRISGVDLENDDLVDEDSLLTEEDLGKPELSAGLLSALKDTALTPFYTQKISYN